MPKEKQEKKVYLGHRPLPPMDIRRFDLRVARVHHILPHPDVKSPTFLQNMVYYQGDDLDREFKLAINGVANYYSLTEMEDKMVVVLVNSKPFVVAGIISRARMMCATTNNRLELLIPPPGSVEGDEVMVEGWPSDPEIPFLLPVQSTLEVVSADLRVNTNKQVLYKGVPLKVQGKGYLRTQMLADCPVVFE